MFPDVRPLIAATLASVVVLICGFCMFAILRVSHEPLARLTPGPATLQVVADKGARLSTAFAPDESFDRRFQVPPPLAPSAAVPNANGTVVLT